MISHFCSTIFTIYSCEIEIVFLVSNVCPAFAANWIHSFYYFSFFSFKYNTEVIHLSCPLAFY